MYTIRKYHNLNNDCINYNLLIISFSFAITLFFLILLKHVESIKNCHVTIF